MSMSMSMGMSIGKSMAIYTKITQFGLARLDFCGRDPPAADCAKPTISFELSVKPTFWASWRPRRPQDGPPGAQESLPTGLLAPKTAFIRASWRARRLPTGPRRLLDGSPVAPDGLQTGLLAPKTASRRASSRRPPTGHHLPISSSADKITCRQVHLATSQP